MPARLDSAVRAAAAGVGLCGAATLALPWWTATPPVLLVPGAPAQTADVWRGAQAVGLTGTLVLAALAVAAVVAVALAPARIARPLLSATGAATAAAGIGVLAGWGATAAPGAWLAAVAGVLVLAGAVGPPLLPVLAAAAVAATTLAVLPAIDRVGGHAGAWTRLAPFADGPPRAGATAVPAGPSRLVTIAGTTAVATDTAIVGLDGHGHARVLARTDVPGEILGVAGDRVVRRIAADRLRVTSLRAHDPLDLEIYAVTAAGPVGPDGSLWLRADGDPPGAIRVLLPDTYQGPQRLAATYLPVLSIGFPPGTVPVDPAAAVPLREGGVRIVDRRLERIVQTPAAATVDVLAGGSDPACGLTRTARDAYLGAATAAPAPAPDGGVWLATADRLLRVDPDGTLRVAADPLPGPVTALVVTPDGAVDALVIGAHAGLWHLPAAATTLAALPPTPACTPHPPRAGPPVTFVPVGTTGPERTGTPLAVTGRWASQVRSEVVAVSGAERTPLGYREDQQPAPVVPDGGGGAWWLEPGRPGHRIAVHARPGAAVERFAEVPAPDAAVPVPDLGGRAPLLASADGLAATVPGGAVPPVAGPVTGGVVRADGRGWFLADGRLVTTDGAVLATLVDAGDRRGDPAPAAVQLARGVAPDRLALTGARIALDASGRPVVVCRDGVVLRADPGTGAVTAIAQDPLLVAPTTVEGGIVQNTDGTLQRVDLPG